MHCVVGSFHFVIINYTYIIQYHKLATLALKPKPEISISQEPIGARSSFAPLFHVNFVLLNFEFHTQISTTTCSGRKIIFGDFGPKFGIFEQKYLGPQPFSQNVCFTRIFCFILYDFYRKSH